VLVRGDSPSERACGGEETAVGGDDEAAAGAEGAPHFKVRAGLLIMKEEASVPCGEG
jgi:hypothetical protein